MSNVTTVQIELQSQKVLQNSGGGDRRAGPFFMTMSDI